MDVPPARANTKQNTHPQGLALQGAAGAAGRWECIPVGPHNAAWVFEAREAGFRAGFHPFTRLPLGSVQCYDLDMVELASAGGGILSLLASEHQVSNLLRMYGAGKRASTHAIRHYLACPIVYGAAAQSGERDDWWPANGPLQPAFLLDAAALDDRSVMIRARRDVLRR